MVFVEGDVVVVVEGDAVVHIEPDDLANMSNLDAFDWTQAAPQRFCLNAVASRNMESMLVTLDTSHFEI